MSGTALFWIDRILDRPAAEGTADTLVRCVKVYNTTRVGPRQANAVGRDPPETSTDKHGDFMLLPKGATVAVADGEKLRMFTNTGDEAAISLTPLPEPEIDGSHKGSGARHQSSAANPDDSQQSEDGFAAGIADALNRGALAGKIDHLVVIAAPRTLGELRKHYHKALVAILVGEISKDLTGHSVHDIEKTLSSD